MEWDILAYLSALFLDLHRLIGRCSFFSLGVPQASSVPASIHGAGSFVIDWGRCGISPIGMAGFLGDCPGIHGNSVRSVSCLAGARQA